MIDKCLIKILDENKYQNLLLDELNGALNKRMRQMDEKLATSINQFAENPIYYKALCYQMIGDLHKLIEMQDDYMEVRGIVVDHKTEEEL